MLNKCIISYHIISCHVMSYLFISDHITLRHMNHRHHKYRSATDHAFTSHILKISYNIQLTWSIRFMSAFASSSNVTTDGWPPNEARIRDVEPFWMIIEWRSLRYFAMSHHTMLLDRTMCHCTMHHDNVDTLPSIWCTVHMHMQIQIQRQTQILHSHTLLSHYYHSHTQIDACSSRLNVSYQTGTVNVCLRV